MEKLKLNVENLEAKSTEQYDKILGKLVENKNQVESPIFLMPLRFLQEAPTRNAFAQRKIQRRWEVPQPALPP